MRWFVYSQGEGKNHLLVEAKNVASSQKRLSRWSARSKVDLTPTKVVNAGIGYETMSEAWHRFGKVTVIDGSF